MKEKKPVFSIIIPAYNEAEFLPGCIQSIRSQIGASDYEIVVVDNNSNDNTGEIAEKFGATVITESRLGVGQARKTGTDIARGKYILHLDADTRLPLDYLIQVLKRFEKDRRLVCLSGQNMFYDAPLWKNILRVIFHYILWFLAFVLSAGKVGPIGNNMTFPKEVYLKTKGFHPSLNYGEDAHLTRQLSKFGKSRLDMSLRCYISDRRYKINFKLLVYLLNLFTVCIFGWPIVNRLPPHAKD